MCYNKSMKIIFPELNSNEIAREAANHFEDIEFIPTDNLEQAVEMLKAKQADTMISGLNYSSRKVLLAYKAYLTLKSKYFSSCFICQKQDQILTIADGGVIKHPNSKQLYTIIEDTVDTFIKYTNKQPKIALLSYSTHGSGGEDTDLEKYQTCIQEISDNHPDWIIDGEMQLDAAVNPRIATKKTPHSPIKGEANVLIVPNLNSGNILYKSLEQFGNFTIAGPMIQGFETPLADLSRGSTVEDVILTIKVLRSLL